MAMVVVMMLCNRRREKAGTKKKSCTEIGKMGTKEMAINLVIYNPTKTHNNKGY